VLVSQATLELYEKICIRADGMRCGSRSTGQKLPLSYVHVDSANLALLRGLRPCTKTMLTDVSRLYVSGQAREYSMGYRACSLFRSGSRGVCKYSEGAVLSGVFDIVS